MLKRKAEQTLAEWKASPDNQALMVTGARQVGKTYLIDEFAKKSYKRVVKFDLVEQTDVLSAFNEAKSSDELFMAISAFAGQSIVAGETVIFIDEIQECKEALTFTKYLVQRKDYDYIISGSLLGVELDDLRSIPVGYLRIVEMYPLDFEEFCWALGFGGDVWGSVRDSFESLSPVFDHVHERLLQLFHWYLIVGGMPQVVDAFARTKDISRVQQLQRDIVELYRHDISKYAPREHRLTIKEIYDQVPSQLDSQSKRFNFASIAPRGTFERYREDFMWLLDAGVAIAVRNVSEPVRPLRVKEDRSFFKLFLNDVGLLSASCGIGTVRKALAGQTSMSYGAIYENAVAQELRTRRRDLHFFRSKKIGEVDFLVTDGEAIVPVEVKSGKD